MRKFTKGKNTFDANRFQTRAMINNRKTLCFTICALSISYAQDALTPFRESITFPKQGFDKWSSEITRRCLYDTTTKWLTVNSSDNKRLYIRTCLSEGSGHVMEYVIGVGDPKGIAPQKGVIFETSTIGWKTLGDYHGEGLPWKLDSTGIIIWDSFNDTGDAYSNASFGLVPWVYSGNSKELKLNTKSTCAMIDSTIIIYDEKFQKSKLDEENKFHGRGSYCGRSKLYGYIIGRLARTKEKICTSNSRSAHNAD